MTTNDAIIERIRKCLALANGKNATQGEAEAAMGKAKEIAMRYNLDIASIALQEGKNPADSLEIGKEELQIRSQREQPYHRYIYMVLREVFCVRTVRFYNGRLVFVGEKTEVVIAKALFPWLEEVFYQTYYTALKAGLVLSCAAHKNGIYLGLAHGIVAANKREEAKLQKQEQQVWALVVRGKEEKIEEALHNEFPDLQKGRSVQRSASAAAIQLGRAKGQNINLRQVGTVKTQQQLNRV